MRSNALCGRLSFVPAGELVPLSVDMNNKFFYTVGSLACLISLFLRVRGDRLDMPDGGLPWVMHLMHLLICGIALYYVYKRLMDKPRINLLAILMLGVGTVFNPIYVPDFPLTTWLIIEITSMVLFFVCSLREKLPVPGDDEKK